jgi:hypothetical protein
MNHRLILFYDTMWRNPRYRHVPEGFEFTTDRRRYAEASTVIFHIPEWSFYRFPKLSRCRWLFAPEKLAGQLWVAWSKECEENYPLLRDPRFMSRFDFTVTYRLNADAPTTYLTGYRGENLAHMLRQPPQAKLAEPLVASFISSGVDRSGRRRYVRELARHLAIDSYGNFMRNRSLTDDRGRTSKLETIARYKFTLAFENACGRDYVTEKFFDPLIAGSVPVYLGAPNVEDFAPGDHCFINTADFPGPKELAEYLIVVARDEAAYQSYLAWKDKPYRAAFQNLLARSAQNPLARLCELVQARLAAS